MSEQPARLFMEAFAEGDTCLIFIERYWRPGIMELSAIIKLARVWTEEDGIPTAIVILGDIPEDDEATISGDGTWNRQESRHVQIIRDTPTNRRVMRAVAFRERQLDEMAAMLFAAAAVAPPDRLHNLKEALARIGRPY